MNHHELPKIDDDGPKNENHIDMDDTDVKELARGGVRASIQQPLNKINNLESEDPGCPLSPIILWGTAISLIFSIGIQLQTYSMLRFTVKMCLRRFAPRNFTLTDCDWSLERELEDPEKLLDVSRKIILSDQIDLESTQLGAGFFGSVFPAKVTVGSAYVTAAVKRIKCSYPSAAQLNSLLNEAEKLDLVGKHHHVLEFLGVCIQNVLQGEILLAFELCEGKSFVGTFDAENPENEYSLKLQLRKWCHQIALGMKYLHHKNVIHLDLALRNVMLRINMTAAIGDFGISSMVTPTARRNYVEQRACCWSSPEVLEREENISLKADIWSYGVCVWELFSLGGEPYQDQNLPSAGELLTFLQNGNILKQPELCNNMEQVSF
ncbi:Fibroblast growth factor receptor [Folsomia candida]|uniref:Fibroblast growth factor receptor n=1 Tax=Folsomia candida TaxID=158441 RepID=A0A226DZ90_FOLCA|nr:Fibroblast growth factor receptor [Folsomia candida]